MYIIIDMCISMYSLYCKFEILLYMYINMSMLVQCTDTVHCNHVKFFVLCH